MEQQAKPQLSRPTSHIRELVQLTYDVSGKADYDPSAWVLSTYVRDEGSVPGSWLLTVTANHLSNKYVNKSFLKDKCILVQEKFESHT